MLERSISTVDQVIDAIKLGIRDARYVPAQRLVEPDLAREYGVSRGSVREALRRLAAEGFVNLERFRGASIIRMSRKQVVDLLEEFARYWKDLVRRLRCSGPTTTAGSS